MSNFVLSFLGSLLGTGVPMFLLGVAIKRKGTTPLAPPLRPCSCKHGLGRHEKTDKGFGACGYTTTELRDVEGPVIRNTAGNPVIINGLVQKERVRKEYRLVCGCKCFDGEIPTDMIGREWMGT